MLCNDIVTKEKKFPVTKTKYYYLIRSEPKIINDQVNLQTRKLSNSETAKRFFKKKFQFRKQLHWKLPLVNDAFNGNEKNQTVPQLQWIKNELNDIKNKLNSIPLSSWSKYTAKRDPSSAIAYAIRNDIRAEFVTKAWCKFYEIVSAYPLVKVDNSGKFNSVHLCEAPGAFVASLNHYLKLNCPESKFKWCATTLNPYYEGNSFDNAVLDDRLMVRTFDNWEFGEDFTGDITNKRNIENLVTRCRKMGKISLVTADGSVDCMECPDDQENKVHYLHFAEVVAALQILDMGGSFVLKMFTFYELVTVSLLYFLNNVFDKVEVFKPASSKQGNSEVYVICTGYQRIYKNMSYLLEMANRIEHNETPLFTLDMISNDFIDQVSNCAKMFMVYQTKAIESNIYHFRRSDIDDKQYIHELRSDIRKEYIRLYGLKSISDEMKILQGESCSDLQNTYAPVVTESGSFTSRLLFKNLTKEDKMLQLRSQLQTIEKRISFQCRVENSPLLINNQYNYTLKAFYGQPIRQIFSSKFVLIQCFKLLLEIVDNSNNNSRDTPLITIDSTSECIIISINIINYKNIDDYDKFEKDLFNRLVNVIIGLHSTDKIRIKNLLLFTHFSVGLIYTLGCVFEEILLTPNGEIHLNYLRSKGKEFLRNILMNRIEFSSSNPNRSVLGIVHVNLLRNNYFYNAVLNYNNKLSLKYCKTLLDEC